MDFSYLNKVEQNQYTETDGLRPNWDSDEG